MKNHTTALDHILVQSITVSRNRVRVPVRLTRHLGIKPGSRVDVRKDAKHNDVLILASRTGNYKVEKDGAIRFPAHKFGLTQNVMSSADRVQNNISVA